MKTKEQVQELITFLKGYIAGQKESHAPNKDELYKAEIKLKTFEEILEIEKINEQTVHNKER